MKNKKNYKIKNYKITKSYFTKSKIMGVNRANEQDAIALMKSNIHSEWINTTMGSGCSLTLKDVYGSVIHEHKYLDIFDITEHVEDAETLTAEERQYYYNEWKEAHEAESYEKFVALCEVKYLYFFL